MIIVYTRGTMTIRIHLGHPLTTANVPSFLISAVIVIIDDIVVIVVNVVIIVY